MNNCCYGFISIPVRMVTLYLRFFNIYQIHSLYLQLFYFLSCFHRAAAVALTERHADYGSIPVEDFNMELEDQSGQKLKLGSETDQKY